MRVYMYIHVMSPSRTRGQTPREEDLGVVPALAGKRKPTKRNHINATYYMHVCMYIIIYRERYRCTYMYIYI